jgi:hypothetical protein
MSWLSKQILFLRRMSIIAFVDLLLASSVLAQNLPASPEHPWHGSAELEMQVYAKNVTDSRFAVDQSKTYSLSELIDLAEANNPATLVAWEHARSRAAALGIIRSELYPTLSRCDTFPNRKWPGFLWERVLWSDRSGF